MIVLWTDGLIYLLVVTSVVPCGSAYSACAILSSL